MARRGRQSKHGIGATGIAALLLLCGAVWVAQQAWPLLVVVAVGALLVYALRRPSSSPSAPVEERQQAPIDATVVTRRTTAGGLVLELSVGDAVPRSVGPAVHPDSVWVPPARLVTIAGYSVPGGMLYVGERLGALNEHGGDEPALVNPGLPVEAARPDRIGEGMPYWPSYSAIPPASRAAYLEWLASGRKDRSVAIGYVFLFFYGLERRLLGDPRQSTAARNEREQLIGEVERLLQIYGEQRSFRGYASSLVDAMRAQRKGVPLYLHPPPLLRSRQELPYTLRVGLAQLAAEGKPIPGQWAWSWLVCSPEASLRTPAQRCPDEHRDLFLARYAQLFESGMTLRPNKTKLSITYQPASASFGGPVSIAIDDLPDVAALSAPVRRLQEIADICAEDLAAYSRWLGRNPDGRDSLEAAALLPPELLNGAARNAVRPLRDWLDGKLRGASSAVVSGADLLRFWPDDDGAKLGKGEAVSVAQLLDRLGYGVEPDVRFGGPVLAAADLAVIFRLPDQSPSAGSPAYANATLLLHIGAAVATADGVVSADEERQLERQLESALRLTSAEQTRLRAHLAWLLTSQPGLTGLKKRVAALDETQRRAIARYVVAVAGADGHFDPTEITALTEIYRPLGFTAVDAYNDIHALASASVPAASEPVTVQRADPAPTGFAIPSAPEREGSGAPTVTLDMARVQATLAETKTVAALLTGIFTDEQADTPPDKPVPPDDTPRVAGLDAAHSALVRALAERTDCARAEFDVMAATHGLLPDGALDAINEAALDRCGEPLCDGDDPLTVNESVAKDLLT